MKKKIFTLALSCTLLWGLAACGNDNPPLIYPGIINGLFSRPT